MDELVTGGQPMDADRKQFILEHLGDPDELVTGLVEFRELAIRMDREHSELLRLYPDRWVAMSKDGVVASAETVVELFRQLDELQIAHSDVVHDYMDTKPRSLIL